jgi:nickel transport protein
MLDMKSHLFLLIILLWSQLAIAHSLHTFAYFSTDHVYTETYFTDGKAVKNAPVEVYESTSKTLLLTGTTDDNGVFTFKTPDVESLKIVVRASMGHLSEIVLEKREDEDEKNMRNDKESIEKKKNNDFLPSNTKLFLTQNEIDKIIELQLDKKLAPIHALLRQIVRQHTKPSLSEIIGGIGYIIGIFGVAAYIYSRKDIKKSHKDSEKS